jgi:hypothetical protein
MSDALSFAGAQVTKLLPCRCRHNSSNISRRLSSTANRSHNNSLSNNKSLYRSTMRRRTRVLTARMPLLCLRHQTCILHLQRSRSRRLRNKPFIRTEPDFHLSRVPPPTKIRLHRHNSHNRLQPLINRQLLSLTCNSTRSNRQPVVTLRSLVDRSVLLLLYLQKLNRRITEATSRRRSLYSASALMSSLRETGPRSR